MIDNFIELINNFIAYYARIKSNVAIDIMRVYTNDSASLETTTKMDREQSHLLVKLQQMAFFRPESSIISQYKSEMDAFPELSICRISIGSELKI